MRRTILMACVAMIMAACASQPAEKQAWVKVEGNKFIDPQGNELVFRGLCLADPVKLVRDGQWTERIFAEAADWGANVVRFAVHPANINSMGWDSAFEAMDQGIEWAKKHGLYVIMDWHSIGNLKDAKYTNPMYNTTLEETLKFWSTAAERYKNEPAVALYEVFNEPTVTGPDTGSCTWEEQWEKDFGFVADTYPVICTEIGFCLEHEKGAHIPVISTEVYGEHITKYFEQKGISFTVWCFDTDWSPTLIEDWNFTPSTQGRFFKAYLQQKAAEK